MSGDIRPECQELTHLRAHKFSIFNHWGSCSKRSFSTDDSAPSYGYQFNQSGRNTLGNSPVVGTKLDLLKANREAILEIAKRNKGLSISVFGSVARGEDTDTSDFDFLVDFAQGASFFDQFQM